MLKTLWYVCLFALVLGQFSLLAGVPGSAVYAFDVLVIIFNIFTILYFLSVKKSFKIPTAGKFGFCFFLTALFSLVFSLRLYTLSEAISGSFYLFRYLAYLLSGVAVYNLVDSKMLNEDSVKNAVILSGVFLSLAGFVQLVLLPDFTVLDPALGWDPHKNRLTSTFFDPNFTGAYLVVCLSLLFDKYYTKRKFSLKDLLFFCLILLAVFLTFSRSAWAMLAIVILIYGWFYSKTMLYVSILVAFSAYFSIPRVQTRLMGATDPYDSARLRIESWQKAGSIISNNILFGVGFNNYKTAQKENGFIMQDELDSHSASGTDSSLLLVLATTGIIGLAVYLASILFPLVSKGNILILPMALVLGLLADSLFINSLFYPQIMFLMFLILCLSGVKQNT